MDYGLVSVIVPVYNRATLVGQAFDSILAQTYGNLEIIAINDGSTDNSLSVLKEYEQRWPAKFHIIDQPNQGQVAARNNGVQAARGKFIAFLDSDDRWLPKKLEWQLPKFTSDVGLVYCAVEFIDGEGEVVGTEQLDNSLQGNIYSQLLIKNRMTGGTVVVRKNVLEDVGLFDPEFKAAENWDLWIRICKKYYAALVDKPLVQYRVHPDNMSKDFELMLAAKKNIMDKHCDRQSSDSMIAKSSALAEADYFYRLGVHQFSTERYGDALASFWRVNAIEPFYEDSLVRMARCLIGRWGNDLLRTLKKAAN